MNQFRQGLQRESDERNKRGETWTNKLRANRQEQEALRKRLKDLEDDERHLEMDVGRLKEEDEHAQFVRDDTHRLMEEWQRKIEDLQTRVLTSIQIMTDMKGMFVCALFERCVHQFVS